MSNEQHPGLPVNPSDLRSGARGTGQWTLELTEDQFNSVILALGIAAGQASKDGDRPRFYGWIKLAKAIGAHNPDWRPYEIPEEYR